MIAVLIAATVLIGAHHTQGSFVVKRDATRHCGITRHFRWEQRLSGQHRQSRTLRYSSTDENKHHRSLMRLHRHNCDGLRAASPGHDVELPMPSRWSRLQNFVDTNFFLLGMVAAVGAARLFPTLGMDGGTLRADAVIGRLGVTLIFLLSGLSLQLEQLKDAMSNVKLNALIQACIFLAWPFVVGLPLTAMLSWLSPRLLSSSLRDGILILSTLPTTVNMCVILTTTAGGNVATALCNAVISNVAGIFATPMLLYRFFGSHIDLPFLPMLVKLSGKVLLPVIIGQLLRQTRAKSIYTAHSKLFKRAQEVILLSILWNAFCTMFATGVGIAAQHSVVLLIILPLLHLLSLGMLFRFFSMPLMKFDRKEVVSGMFCASHKTLAFGLPLVQTIFEGSGNLASYCAPIMFIHPIQLVIGSALVPRLFRYIENDVNTSENAA